MIEYMIYSYLQKRYNKMNKKKTIKRKKERDLKIFLKNREPDLEDLRSRLCTNATKPSIEPITQPMSMLHEVNSFSIPKRNKINPIFLRYLL